MSAAVSPCPSTFHVASNLQPIRPPREAEHILKIGVELDQELIYYDGDLSLADKTPQYVKLDQHEPLETAIVQLCQTWGFENPARFALHFTHTKHDYITQKNRHEIKNGWVVALSVSPVFASGVLISKLEKRTSNECRLEILGRIDRLATDIAFAEEFLTQTGLTLITNMIKTAECSGPTLSLLLHCFCELMEHGISSWDDLDEDFVARVASYVTGKAKHEDRATLVSALIILELLVSNGANQYALVSKEVKFEHLIRHLDKSDQSVQHYALALMNALFVKADYKTKDIISQHVCGRPVRNALETNVLKRGAVIGTDLGHQLGVLQRLLFNHLYTRAQTPFSSSTQADQDKLQELRCAAFESCSEAMSPTTARRHQQTNLIKEFKKLGFEMILENSCRIDGHECPFAEISIELTKLLLEILKMAEPPSEERQQFYELFFKKEHPFEDFFAVCIGLLRKTWKEMHAGLEDKNKVTSVLREQVSRSLSSFPTSYEKFQEEINRYGYQEIQQIWQQERARREQSEFQAKPILELREELKSEILKLIRKNRLNILERGQVFPKLTRGTNSKKEKGKFWFWKLSANHKALLYKDCDENSPPTLDDSDDRLAVSDIRELVTGKLPPQHSKDSSNWGKRSVPSAFSFALRLDNPDERFNFVAPGEDVYNVWTDGLNTLLSQEMKSKQKDIDLETLLDLEVKIRLLDLEGITIPNTPPPIPPPPPDFDFAYD